MAFFHHIQPVVKILAELSLLHHVQKISIGRADQPHIRKLHLVAAQTLECFFLQYAQKLRLKPQSQVANFVEEKCAVVCRFHAALPCHHCSGESAFLVPKQLVFHKRFGKIRAGECHQRIRASRTHLVHCPRQQFLAGSRFPGNQHVHVAGANSLGQLEQFHHCWGAAQQIVQSPAAFFLAANPLQLAFHGKNAVGACEEDTQFQNIRRVQHDVARALFNRANQEAPVFRIAESQNRRVPVLRHDLVEQSEPFLFGLYVRAPQVQTNYVRPFHLRLQRIHVHREVRAEDESLA